LRIAHEVADMVEEDLPAQGKLAIRPGHWLCNESATRRANAT
jgi:hypothetical protein